MRHVITIDLVEPKLSFSATVECSEEEAHALVTRIATHGLATPMHPGGRCLISPVIQAVLVETPITEERANADETPPEDERANADETPIADERAIMSASPERAERAIAAKSPKSDERATNGKSPSAKERASTQESPTRDERSICCKAPVKVFMLGMYCSCCGHTHPARQAARG